MKFSRQTSRERPVGAGNKKSKCVSCVGMVASDVSWPE
jgi:hypothetical protein